MQRPKSMGLRTSAEEAALSGGGLGPYDAYLSRAHASSSATTSAPAASGGYVSSATGHMAQQYREHLIRTPENAMRRRGMSDIHPIEGLHERLETLASRLGNVDERSLRLQELLQQAGVQPGDVLSGHAEYADTASPYPPISPSPSLGWLNAREGGLEDVGMRAVSSAGPSKHPPGIPFESMGKPRPYSSGAVLGVTGEMGGRGGAAVGRGEEEGRVDAKRSGVLDAKSSYSSSKTPNAVVTLLEGIQGKLAALDYIFIKATPTQHAAATKITKLAKGFLRRRKYFYGMQALKSFSERQSQDMVKFFDGYLAYRRKIAAQVRAMELRRDSNRLGNVFAGLAERVLKVMPLRVNQRQRAYFMTIRVERRWLSTFFQELRTAVQNCRGLTEVAAKNQSRYRRMRDKVEFSAEQEGWREELIESVVKQEMQEEAVAIMGAKRRQLASKMMFVKWHKCYDRNKRRKRLVMQCCSKRCSSKGFENWKEYVRECKRWDPGRYVRLRNERTLQMQAVQYTYKSYFKAWNLRTTILLQVKRRAKYCRYSVYLLYWYKGTNTDT